MRILLLEDEKDTVEIIKLYLEKDGYIVDVAYDGLEGLRSYRELKPDLIVIDVMLPGLDGMEVCRLIRGESWVPIIMLTARVEEPDRISGLTAGADDYISKPFSPRELVARIRAVLRRAEPDLFEKGPYQLSYGQISVDLKLHELKVGHHIVQATPTEMRILATLLNFGSGFRTTLTLKKNYYRKLIL